MEYAGAKNPMWVVANGEVEEYKGHIMPIGGFLKMRQSFPSIK